MYFTAKLKIMQINPLKSAICAELLSEEDAQLNLLLMKVRYSPKFVELSATVTVCVLREVTTLFRQPIRSFNAYAWVSLSLRKLCCAYFGTISENNKVFYQ